MLKAVKWFNLGIFLLILCDVTRTPCLGQWNSKNNKNKGKGNTPSSGGKFIPGKTRLGNQPKPKKPTVGQVLRKNGWGTPGRPGSQPWNQNQAPSNPEIVNRRNYLNNLKNNNHANQNNVRGNTDRSVLYPNIGKVTPPLTRSQGEKPPFAPSWTHCVISIQVSTAWVIVKSPNYPNKFQGQVQCSWIATAMEGYRVRLSFKDLDLLPPNGNGCGNQFVEVIDQDLQKSQARFCGSQVPGDYVSSGKQLRLDLQADAIQKQYKGFQAAFRADREVPGRREISYFAHGDPQYNYNPLTESPPVNPGVVPNFPRRAVTRRPATRAPVRVIPGQNIYGVKNQPHMNDKDEEPDQDNLNSSTAHLYIIIAVILVILIAAAAGYVFKRYFYKQFKAWRKKRKQDDPNHDKAEMQTMKDEYGTNKQSQLPGLMPLPPTPSLTTGRRQSVSFREGDYNEDDFFGLDNTMPIHENIPPPSYGSFNNLRRTHSLEDFATDPWMQGNGEPIYEDDNMSLRSAESFRSSNRHPDHDMFRRKKILDRQNSLLRRSNSFSGSIGPHPSQNAVYNSLDPFQANSLYSQEMYYPNQMQNVYGSLPPTHGQNSNGIYNITPAQPMTPRPLYTSSMSNLATGPVSGIMAQQQSLQPSKSMFNVANSIASDVTSQWSNAFEQRNPSVTSSTNISSSSTNPILKKTSQPTQNELAFTALRAAKSMNDLTAINTKLNECVSWTLPSQRRRSVVE